MRVFRKESVAGMNRINIGDLCGADDPIDLEVTLRAWRGSDADGFIGELNMEAFHVRLGIDSDGLDAELLASSDDSEGDFASIGDEDFLEHCVTVDQVPGACGQASSIYLTRKRVCPNCTGLPFSAHLGNDARDLGLDLVHHLHGFDDANHGVGVTS